MKYFYLRKDDLQKGIANIVMQEEQPIQNYEKIQSLGGLTEYYGEQIPGDWEYDGENDVLYSASERPTKFHRKIKGQWQVVDKEGFQEFCKKNIDKIKAEILEYGFDYQGHRQKCRDKDVAYMVANIVSLQTAKALGKEKKVTWYFSDNYGMEAGLQELGILMLYGTTFVQSVYDTENYFKTLEELKIVTKEEFEEKRREIHQALAN
ncbi:hypothetical protein EPT53_09370 [Fusobacterium necrophorum]|uniref:DUF4376 domain-containing protein n=2 Tax=Fusobacterium necrophorum TaxID=859 RepID=A0A4Q2KST6_9FUSO|nr:hypothetical protein [Fusobacterium necrophorum]RXZ68555.1 hypothetical protein EPT53_09370 [Fusobacterium necrophorum]